MQKKGTAECLKEQENETITSGSAGDTPVWVLHVVSRLAISCGVMSVLMKLYRQMDRERVQFAFLTHERSPMDYGDEIQALGGRIHQLPKPAVGSLRLYRRQLRQVFVDHPEYRVVHGHVPVLLPFYMPEVLRQHVPRRILHSHSSRHSATRAKQLRNACLSRFYRYSHTDYFACSRESARLLYGRRIPEDRVLILRNAVNPDAYRMDSRTQQEIRRSLGLENNWVMGHVGRFAREKNHLFLLQIFEEVLRRRPDARLLLVGAGEMDSEIRETIGQRGLEGNVILSGPRRDVPALLQAMDCFVLPSLFEGLPLTVVEAQAAGVPCVVSDQVTDEVRITALVRTVSLSQSAGQWAEAILSWRPEADRLQIQQDLRERGFDVRQTAKWLAEYYTGETEVSPDGCDSQE